MTRHRKESAEERAARMERAREILANPIMEDSLFDEISYVGTVSPKDLDGGLRYPLPPEDIDLY